ncbi:Conserved_hypothetical protein [Hexamita inflata]|uniref:Uncharacterized protein n=1 Tax=Hexamita inflata TaxID=28002 RepID=A0AA86PKV6_9EUKA|nr:Conserved hypothetical protein [Hexamita inflata]
MQKMQMEVQLIVIAREQQERINAEILCQTTQDPHQPLEIIITSRDNLLLYFQSLISPQMMIVMASRLLMEPLKPEDAPLLLQELIQAHVDHERQFMLVSEDSINYTLTVTDIISRQRFPRFALPMTRLSSEKVAEHLKSLLGAEFGNTRILRQQITGLETQNTQLTQELVKFKAQAQHDAQTLTAQLNETKRALVTEQYSFNEFKAQSNSQISLLKSDLSHKNEQISVQQQQLTKNGDEIDRLRQICTQNDVQIQDLTTQKSFLSNNLKQLNEEYSQIKKLKDDLTLQNTNLQLQNQKLTVDNQQLTLKLQTTTSEYSEYELKTTHHIQKIESELKNTLQAYQDTQLALQKSQEETKISQMEARYLKAENQETFKALNQAVTKAEEYQQDYEQMKVQLEEISNQNELLKQQHEKQTVKLSSTEDQNQKMETEIIILKKENEQLRIRAESAETTTGLEIMNHLQGDKTSKRDQQKQELKMSSLGVKPESIVPKYSTMKTSPDSVLEGYSRFFTQNQYSPSAQSEKSTPPLRTLQQPTIQPNIKPAPQKQQLPPKMQSSDSVEYVDLKAILQNQPKPRKIVQNESVSDGTKRVISQYMKGNVNLENLNESNSSDLIFKVMDTVDMSYKPFNTKLSQNADSLQSTKAQSEIVKEPMTKTKVDKQILNKYLSMMNADIE